ncbi:MAG: hypothetical protein IKT61_05540, partial [Clostridia bacterium]|nr:hypothetical protein [Clostridia bacterium]
TAMNYVYTGKGDYTYYCYTNSKTPTIILSVDEVTTAEDTRVCYPTTVVKNELLTAKTEGVTKAEYNITDNVTANNAPDYSEYLKNGIGTAFGKDYYSQKSVVTLNPVFDGTKDKATVTYTIKAHDDAFAGVNNEDLNYAKTATLKSGKNGTINIPQNNGVTPENTITIIIDYHNSEGVLKATAAQVGADEWLNQFHLTRTSGGASNWELPQPADSVYTVYDNTYGQNDYGSFTYTFYVGAENLAGGYLASADEEYIINLLKNKNNFNEIKKAKFSGTNGNGAGLGFLQWGTNYSFNYYPASEAYTYVHLVDRWGNTFDGVFKTPKLDAKKATMNTSSTGLAEVIESGGSGINTMSFSAQSFDIIAEDDAILTPDSYTTKGNSVKVYTGEANKSYNLTVKDLATNSTTASAKTDAEGYLTITVEDLAFDTQSGAYSFTLNDMTINLYAETDKNIISAEGASAEAGQTATVQIETTEKVTMVQLVSENGTTTTATEYEETEDGTRVWYIDKALDAGEYEYTVRAKVDGKWVNEGDKVTVTFTAPTVFVGAVTSVEYTPSESTRNEFKFTVTGRPEKIQVIEPDGGTRTYDRYHTKVEIVSYDEAGNEVSSMSRELSYEVWTIEMNVPADIELTAIARYGRVWSKDNPYKYTVVLATPEYDDEVYSMELAAEEGWQGKVGATVVTGLDVSGVRFVMDDGTTATYYKSTEADGKLTYTGAAWMNHSGENVIIVKIRVNNAWITAGELNYYAF